MKLSLGIQVRNLPLVQTLCPSNSQTEIFRIHSKYVKMFKIFKNDFGILEVVTWKTRIDSERKFTVGNVRNLAVENQISSGEGIFRDLITKSQPSYHITKSKFQ